MLLGSLGIVTLSFCLIVYTVISVTASFLVERRMRENLALVDEFALEAASYLKNADANGLYELCLSRAEAENARFLILSPGGTVWIDTLAGLSGVRLGHAEVVDIAQGGATLSYGLHNVSEKGALPSWVGYYTAAVAYDADMVGIAMMSASVQDVFDQLAQIQQSLFLGFLLVLLLVSGLTFWFSSLITSPINALNDVMQQAVRQGFSVRFSVKGNDEVAQLGQTFNAMSEKLQNMDKMRNDFISNASHELKTPLSAMKILIESLLSTKELDEAMTRDFLGDINREIDRLNLIVQDLLTLVRFDGKTMPLKKELLSLGELAYDMVQRLSPIAQRAGIDVDVELDELCYVEGDPSRLAQVVYNLVDNAIKYTPKGGRVLVQVGRSGQRVLLKVQDTGIGIPESAISHIFDRFYRVDKARSRATGGTGLGLSIVQNIVRVHDGDIEVQSKDGEGTCFTVYLPAAPDPLDDFDEPDALAADNKEEPHEEP